MNITIRNLHENIFRKFKASATEKGVKLGVALTQAMELWVKKSKEPPPAKLSSIKPFNWGKETEKTSREVDKLLYEK
jgi:hypothetical protein